MEAKIVQQQQRKRNPEAQTCSSCQITCTNEQYCSTTRKDFYLCRPCFIQGKYPLEQKSGYFIIERLAAAKQKEESDQSKEEKEDEPKEKEQQEEEEDDEEDKWTEKEELALKEGLSLHHDNWEKIADHVGTRTHDECILHYLELPTSDNVFEQQDELLKLGLLQYNARREEDNPIMTAVAFLASAVEPKVALAAASGSIPTTTTTTVEEKKEEEKEEAKTNGTLEKEEVDEEEQKELLKLQNRLIEVKLKQYQQQAQHYDVLENIVQEQKRLLEKERRQLEIDQLSLKSKIITIRSEMIKKIQANQAAQAAQAQAAQAQFIAQQNNITPAQLQQKLLATQQQQQHQQQQMNPSMFLNNASSSPIQQQQQRHQSPQALQQLQLQQQQQQYQLQMQLQMQQQQRGSGAGALGFNNNNMSL